MKYKTSPLHVLPIAALAMGFFLPSARAAFVTGFETSSGYGTNASVIGVHDTAAPGSNAWTSMFGAFGGVSTINSSTAHPQTGSQALNITKTAADPAMGATLNLGSSIDLTNPFTITFAMSIESVSAGTGNQAQFLFGTIGSDVSSQPHWTRIVYNDGTLYITVNNAAGNGSQEVSLGSYTTYSPIGSYVTFSLSIDPTTFKYTNVQVSGSTSSANLTSTVLASASGGTVPHLNFNAAETGGNVSFLSGGNDAVNVNFDNLSVVPEPGSAFLLGAGLSLLLLMGRNRQSKKSELP